MVNFFFLAKQTVTKNIRHINNSTSKGLTQMILAIILSSKKNNINK